jgi:predicted NodU family carbamoyl transferase
MILPALYPFEDQYHLGINLGHDRAAAITSGGSLLVAIEQERLDRQKHSPGIQRANGKVQLDLPWNAIHYCLDAVGIDLHELASVTANSPGHDFGPQLTARCFGQVPVRQLPSHHLGHAYSAWWPSGLKDSIVLVVDATGTTDGNGLTESYTLYRGGADELELIHAEKVDATLTGVGTLGMLYEEVTRRIGFVTRLENGLSHAEAGKTMGLAPYGGKSGVFSQWIHARKGSYSLEIPGYDILLEIEALEKAHGQVEGKPWMRSHLVELAAKAQQEIEDALLHLVREAKRETGLNHLCLAGGVALNSVANHRIVRELELDGFFAFPAAGDSGIAAGCALWANHKHAGYPVTRVPMTQATLGRCSTRAEVEAAVQAKGDELELETLAPAEMIKRTAEALAMGRIVARFEGGSEYGPRALGHRSILADPTFGQMRDVLNLRVKHREAYRPFAPVVPLEAAEQVFELGAESPHMLLVAPVRTELREVLPSITHYDGTGRVQTVVAHENRFLHSVCTHLSDLRGGPPVVLNTSYNLAGEPIVESAEDALRTFMATDLDHLALEEYWICKKRVAPKKYAEHTLGLPEAPLPQGLAADTPDLSDLTNQLHAALQGDVTESPWSPDELEQLQTRLLPYRGTSRKYSQEAAANAAPEPKSTISQATRARNLQFDTTPTAANSEAQTTFSPFGDLQYPPNDVLIALGARLRALSYDEQNVSKRLGKSPQEIEPTDLPYLDGFHLRREPLDDLIRLFLLRGALGEDRVRSLLGSENFDFLLEMAAIGITDGLCRAKVDLFPVEDLVIATDHRYQVLEGDSLTEEPVMYLGCDSIGLVKTAPREHSESHLDLCTGSGVQALVAARYADRVVGVDLNPRALRFSRFNAALNGVTNATFRCGDLYEPVRGQRFQSITANPPFVPSPTDTIAFRDGGADGEEVLRRIVGNAHLHLKKGGRISIVTDLVAPDVYPEKLTGWWQGPPVCAQILTTANRNEALFSVPHAHAPFGQTFEDYADELSSWIRSYRAAGLKAVNFGYILMRKSSQLDRNDIVQRVVESPLEPIHEFASGLLDFQELRGTGALSGLQVHAAPGLTIRSEQAPGCSKVDRTAVVRGSSWHTQYTIDLVMQSLLESAATGKLDWDTIRARNLEDYAIALVEKGLLAVSGQSRASEGDHRLDATASSVILIDELQSKTTPTCLSNYLC